MKREHIFAHYEEDASRYWKLQEGGYATPMSVRQGERVIFHISNSRSYYDIFVFREGANRRLVKEINDLRGALHAVPNFGYRDGFDWPETASFAVPDNWPSGVYIASFPTGQGLREILFVVRPKTPQAPILLTVETNTYAAYNPVGGKCLFPYISTDRRHSELLSFARPLQPDFMGGFYAWDQFFTSWLDAEGFADAADAGLNKALGIHHDRYYCTVAVNETEFKGTVFTAATIEWAHGLYRDDSPVAQITRNVLNRLGYPKTRSRLPPPLPAHPG